MLESREGRRQFVCWSGSVVLHLAMLFVGLSLLLKAPRVTVQAGETSTEIELIAELPVHAPPVPVLLPVVPTAPHPAPPPMPTPVPLQATRPAPQEELAIEPKPTPVKPQAPASHAAEAPVRKVVVTKSSSAAQGAIPAQPDELRNEPPAYPEESREAREEGLVVLRVEVSAGGDPLSVAILHSSGYFRLDQAARRAVQQWKFRPGTEGGAAVRSEVDTPVRFRLE
jgi:protein TonB